MTGAWEGDLGGTEFLQVNIVQVGNVLCGYTWDHLYTDKGDFCKAYFSGYYDRDKNEYILNGASFFANSGNHVLMNLRLKSRIAKKEFFLEGIEQDPDAPLLFSLMSRQSVSLRRVSRKPGRMPGRMMDCIRTKTQTKKPMPVTRPFKPAKKAVVPVSPVDKKIADTVKKITPPPVPVLNSKDSNNNIVKLMTARKNTALKHLLVNERNITLTVFDNGIVDDDTVSVFYNGKLLLSHQHLSEKPIVIPITLDEKTSIHEITLFAENLGSIPPNTALVVVKAGDKRYELFASASLTENAVISFEYKPK
jgi:hypothetical protein